MKKLSANILLAVLLALGVASQSAAQTSSEAPHAQPPRQQRPAEKPHESAVKITETPAEEPPPAAQPPAATTPPPASGQVREESGITAARDWLALVDSGNYAGAYDQAGEIFRGNTPREQWQAGLENSRRAVGLLGERNLKSALVAVNLPNAPQGKYVITTFETKFQQTAQAVPEVVTSYLTGGGWKVVGYQIKANAGAPASGGGGQAQPQSPKPSR